MNIPPIFSQNKKHSGRVPCSTSERFLLLFDPPEEIYLEGFVKPLDLALMLRSFTRSESLLNPQFMAQCSQITVFKLRSVVVLQYVGNTVFLKKSRQDVQGLGIVRVLRAQTQAYFVKQSIKVWAVLVSRTRFGFIHLPVTEQTIGEDRFNMLFFRQRAASITDAAFQAFCGCLDELGAPADVKF